MDAAMKSVEERSMCWRQTQVRGDDSCGRLAAPASDCFDCRCGLARRGAGAHDTQGINHMIFELVTHGAGHILPAQARDELGKVGYDTHVVATSLPGSC